MHATAIHHNAEAGWEVIKFNFLAKGCEPGGMGAGGRWTFKRRKSRDV